MERKRRRAETEKKQIVGSRDGERGFGCEKGMKKGKRQNSRGQMNDV